MDILFWMLVSIIAALVIYISYKIVFHYLKILYYQKKSDNLRFLFIKVPRKDSDLDQKNDTIQNMKQNIEVMNQVYKNVYSISSWKFMDKMFWQNYISLEILVEKESIKFIFWVPVDFVETFEKMISSFSPSSVIEQISQPKLLDAWKFAYWWYLVLAKDNPYPIKTYDSFEADPMDSILSAFSRVNWDEKLSMQILVSPLNEKWQWKLRKSIEKIKTWHKFSFFWMILWFFASIFDGGDDKKKDNDQKKNWLSSGQVQDVEKKAEDEWFEIVLRALAVTPDPTRAERIINDLVRAMNQYNYIWLNYFVFLPAEKIENFIKDYVKRVFCRPFFTMKKFLFFIKSQILNIKELSSIYHFPHSKFNKNPRIKWQNYKIIPAPDTLPEKWVLLGYNMYGWVKKEVRIAPEDRFRHFYNIWQTGTWKSTLMLVQAKQDLDQWRWFALIDPHGDLCEFILQSYPKSRIDDLIYFNASDFDMPIGFNVFEAETEEEKDIVINDLVEMFIQMYWPEIFGPRIQDYFRYACLTLMEQPEGWTMIEIVRLFVDEAYQKLKLKNVKNAVVRMWWEKTYNAMWQKEKSEMIPYFQSKFGPYTTTPIIRNIIGQPKSSFDIYDAMQNWKIILLNLSKWQMWELNSKLLWSMMVTQLKLWALRRARIPEKERNPYFMYIDEFQNYINPSIETILSEARKYRLWLIVAHQYIEQLVKKSLGWEMDLRPAIFGNVWSMMVYKIWAKDAEYVEQEFAPEISRSDLVNMDRYKWVAKISVNTQPTRPFSLNVLDPYKDPPVNTPEKVKVIKEISRLKWWRKKDLVEKEIFYRVWV